MRPSDTDSTFYKDEQKTPYTREIIQSHFQLVSNIKGQLHGKLNRSPTSLIW